MLFEPQAASCEPRFTTSQRLVLSVYRHVAPDPLDGDQKRFELDERGDDYWSRHYRNADWFGRWRRNDRGDDHWSRHYRNADRFGRWRRNDRGDDHWSRHYRNADRFGRWRRNDRGDDHWSRHYRNADRFGRWRRGDRRYVARRRVYRVKRRVVVVGIGNLTTTAMDFGKRTDGRQVLGSGPQDLLELGRGFVVLADLDERAAERDARGRVRGMPKQSLPGRSRSPRRTCRGGGTPRRAPRRRWTPGPVGPGASIRRDEVLSDMLLRKDRQGLRDGSRPSPACIGHEERDLCRSPAWRIPWTRRDRLSSAAEFRRRSSTCSSKCWAPGAVALDPEALKFVGTFARTGVGDKTNMAVGICAVPYGRRSRYGRRCVRMTSTTVSRAT